MRAFTSLLLALGCTSLFSQQVPQYTQYAFNMFAVNPAVAGSKDCMDVRLGVRQQWTGFEGAPMTGWATLCGTIGPKRRSYRANRQGIGAFIQSDATGPLGRTTVQLAYAYHLQVRRDVFLSMGLFGGVTQERLSPGLVRATDNNDPTLLAGEGGLVYPELTPGLWFYTKTTWAGLSIQQLLGNKVPDLGTENILARHYIATIGHRYRVSKDFSVVPSGLFKLSPGSPLSLDINAMLEYKKRLGLGISYRNQDAVAFMVKLPFLKYFTLGYSYDVTTSDLRVGGANTHEVILAIYPCTPLDPAKAIVRCPIFE